MFRYFYVERAMQFNIAENLSRFATRKLATDMAIFSLQLQYLDISHSP